VDHTAAVQVAERVPTYPVIQAGAHVIPVLVVGAHVPAAELAMGGRVEHVVLTQIPVVVQVEVAVQVAVRVPAKSVLQVGTQDLPEGVGLQSPGPEFAMGGAVVHGGGTYTQGGETGKHWLT